MSEVSEAAKEAAGNIFEEQKEIFNGTEELKD